MRVAIIGCGITGMSAGIMLQKAGIDTVIFEKMNNPGGVIAIYKKDGILINNALEFVLGTAQNTFANDMWQSLGLFKKSPKIKNCFNRFLWDNNSVSIYKDFNKTVNEMISLSPQDKKMILKLAKSVKKFQKLEVPLITKKSRNILVRLFSLFLHCFTVIPDVLYYGTINCKKYGKKIKGRELREFFSDVLNSERTVLQYIALWSFFSSGNFNTPENNQQEMVETLYDNYINSGGEVFFNKCLTEVMIENKNIRELKFIDGTECNFDYVIFSNDIASVNKVMTNSNKKLPILEKTIAKEHVTSSCVLYFKLDCADAYSIDENVSIPCKPFKVGNRYLNNFSVRTQKNTNTYNSAISVTIYQNESDFLEWKAIYNVSKDLYNKEKYRIAQDILNSIEEQFPDIRGKLQLCDMVTPLTYHRYTGVNYGGWMPESWNPLIYLRFGRGHMPGIRNASITGQKVFPIGGTTIGAFSGVKLAEKIIKIANKN